MSLAARLREALEGSAGNGPIADSHILDDADYARAAVLVPITARPEPGVILTVRHADLRRHAGQVAFPGGRIDPEDADGIAAALREADEEIGLAPADVEVVGTSDLYRTGTGFEILPVLGVVPPDLALVPHEVEVADVFEVPLAFLLERANHVERSAEYKGQMRTFYEMWWGERRIWGATAGMIVNLAGRLGRFA